MVRRFLTRLLLVILIAFCAYNWFEVRQLQRQVNELSGRLAVRPPAAEPLDWQDAQRRLQALQTKIKELRSQADAFWQRGHSPHKQSVPSP